MSNRSENKSPDHQATRQRRQTLTHQKIESIQGQGKEDLAVRGRGQSNTTALPTRLNYHPSLQDEGQRRRRTCTDHLVCGTPPMESPPFPTKGQINNAVLKPTRVAISLLLQRQPKKTVSKFLTLQFHFTARFVCVYAYRISTI